MELNEALALPEGPERTTAIVAWIQNLFADDDEVPVLVGGAAVEILTGGAYTTGDLDFVGSVPATIGAILKENGFEKTGRHWIHRKAQVFVEFPGSSLGPNEASIRFSAFGHDIILVSIEDLLVDRLGAWQYWKSGVDGANAFILYRVCRQMIDDRRLESRAKDEGFESAVDALRAFDREWTPSDPPPEALEQWANRGPGAEDE